MTISINGINPETQSFKFTETTNVPVKVTHKFAALDFYEDSVELEVDGVILGELSSYIQNPAPTTTIETLILVKIPEEYQNKVVQTTFLKEYGLLKATLFEKDVKVVGAPDLDLLKEFFSLAVEEEEKTFVPHFTDDTNREYRISKFTSFTSFTPYIYNNIMLNPITAYQYKKTVGWELQLADAFFRKHYPKTHL